MIAISGFLWRFLLTGTLASVLIMAQGQDQNAHIPAQNNPEYEVRWIGQYPVIQNKEGSKNREGKRRKNRNWFTDLIFGKKPDGLVKPMSIVALDPDNYWVADQGNGSILQVKNEVGEITQFKNRDIESFPSIIGTCLTPEHHILFTDSRLNGIYQYIPGLDEVRTFNDSLSLEQPTGIAYSFANDQVWVVETSAHRIAVLNKQGEVIRHIGERGNAPGKFNFPTYLWIDPAGLVYVVDAMNFRVQIFDKNGKFISAFGEIGDATGYFSRPKGIATDSFGHIYVSDALFHVVQIFDRNGQLLYTFGSQGQGKEQFWMPTGIYIDKENFIYIADSYNSRVQVFQLTSGD